jgi:hypothetical protein
MDKKRTLIVKHPRLKFIRDTLRQTIVSAVYKEKSRLIDEQLKYDVSKDEDKLIPLVRKEQALQRALNASTCKCPTCGSKTSDMMYNSVGKAWFCISCYEKRHEWYKTHPHSTEDPDAPNPFP